MSSVRPGSRPVIAAMLSVVLAASLTALLAACGSSSSAVTAIGGSGSPASGLRGLTPQTPIVKPAVRLTDTGAHPYDLVHATRGRVVLVYFGYTQCPDVCPTTMADLADALSKVKADVKAQVTVIFVTTDPMRDALPVLGRWLAQLDSSFVGLTGTLPQVHAAAMAMGVPLEDPERQPNGSYAVTHGTQVTAFGRDDKAHVVYLAGTPVADYAHDLPILVGAPGTAGA